MKKEGGKVKEERRGKGRRGDRLMGIGKKIEDEYKKKGARNFKERRGGGKIGIG